MSGFKQGAEGTGVERDLWIGALWMGAGMLESGRAPNPLGMEEGLNMQQCNKVCEYSYVCFTAIPDHGPDARPTTICYGMLNGPR